MNSPFKTSAILHKGSAMLILCAGLLGIVQTSQAMTPRTDFSTNTVTGKVTTTFTFAPAGGKASAAPPLRLRLCYFWWDLKDYVKYGIPYGFRNDPLLTTLFGPAVLVLVWITLRFLSLT